MKLITLNIWGGHVREPLINFFKRYQDVDFFCLQEVYHNAAEKISNDDRFVSLNIFSELQALLPDHRAFFRPVVEDFYGIGLFVKNSVEVLEEGEVSIHDDPHYPGRGPAHSRSLQWVKCMINKKPCVILNVHGLWNGQGKTDTLARIAQSEKICAFMRTLSEPKILCGDFNLRPDTQSMKMIEAGMKNWVSLSGVTCTRTSWYPKPEKFADYILTSPEIEVAEFRVMEEEVSDHSALYLAFEL